MKGGNNNSSSESPAFFLGPSKSCTGVTHSFEGHARATWGRLFCIRPPKINDFLLIVFVFFWPAEPFKMIFLTRFGLLGLLPIDLSQKIAEKRDSQSSKSSSDDPFQAIFHFFIDLSRRKSTIFLGYSHSIGVSHHFHHRPFQLPIESWHFSIRPT